MKKVGGASLKARLEIKRSCPQLQGAVGFEWSDPLVILILKQLVSKAN